MKRLVNPRLVLSVVAAAFLASFSWVSAQQPTAAAVAIDADDIGGVVTSAKGPEAGVWVVAETTDLPTKFARMVVTDDRGRYALPDLPQANYQLFVRGYGLVDSARIAAKPGQHMDLKAVVAPDGRAAAQIYPANYWLSLLEIPKGEHSPQEFALETKACFSCHQVGTRATREIPKGSLASMLEAWDRHTAMGPNGGNMSNVFKGLGEQRKAFADWTDRIAAGAYPEAPPRPVGVERNLVISMWDWGLPTSRRSDAMDDKGHVWVTARIRAPKDQPAYCKDPANKFAKYFPVEGPSARQIELLDPKTKQFKIGRASC